MCELKNKTGTHAESRTRRNFAKLAPRIQYIPPFECWSSDYSSYDLVVCAKCAVVVFPIFDSIGERSVGIGNCGGVEYANGVSLVFASWFTVNNYYFVVMVFRKYFASPSTQHSLVIRDSPWIFSKRYFTWIESIHQY